MVSTPVCVQTPKLGLQQILNANGTALLTVVTGGTNGTKVTSLTLTSSDTSQRIIQVWVTRSGTSYLLGSVTVAASSGFDGATSVVSVLSSTLIPGLPVDNDGQPYLLLMSGDTLQIGSTTTVTSGKIIYATAVEADF